MTVQSPALAIARRGSTSVSIRFALKLRLLITLSLILAGAAPAAAGPYTEIASALDAGDPFDLHVSIDYALDVRRAAIEREFAGFPGSQPDDPLPVVKDLYYRGTRHTLTPRVELGVFTDLALSFGLPIVIRDSRSLELDQRADPCVFPGGDETPTCIDRTNSSTIIDGLLPASGFDAGDPGGPGFTDLDDPTIFRGPTRSGLDQLHLGLLWAPMNQRRDDTKPTWKLGAELRLAVGSVARFDRRDPEQSTGVGRGVHEVRLWTSIAKRAGWAEPYFEVWWMAPIGTTDDSPFFDPGFGAARTPSQQTAGTRFGFEAIFWENVADRQRVSLDFMAKLQANFEGRAYTEMWEVFAYAGDAQAGGPLVLDENPVQTGLQARSHPGVSNVENYLTFAGRLGVRAELGERVQFGAGFQLQHDQGHLLSFADAGIDRPTCDDGQSTGCETERNEVVNPGTEEVNPLHVQTIDLVGHRYRIDDAYDYIVLVDATVLF